MDWPYWAGDCEVNICLLLHFDGQHDMWTFLNPKQKSSPKYWDEGSTASQFYRNSDQHPDDVPLALAGSVQDLQCDYLDLYLVYLHPLHLPWFQLQFNMSVVLCPYFFLGVLVFECLNNLSKAGTRTISNLLHCGAWWIENADALASSPQERCSRNSTWGLCTSWHQGNMAGYGEVLWERWQNKGNRYQQLLCGEDKGTVIICKGCTCC